jgi:hypothetical protein
MGSKPRPSRTASIKDSGTIKESSLMALGDSKRTWREDKTT